jgi:DNA repair exonuclease SbcCD ATPase subunit
MTIKKLNDEISQLKDKILEADRKTSILGEMENRLRDAVHDIRDLENIVRQKEELNLKLTNEMKDVERNKQQLLSFEEKIKLLMDENERFAGLVQERDKEVEKWRGECLALERYDIFF